MSKTKIILVDDHEAFRKGFKMVIEELPDVEVIAEVSNGTEFLEILNTLKPDLVFMDIRMPGINGLEVSRSALRTYPEIKIIMLSMFGEIKYIEDAISSGAAGFLLKPPSLRQLQKAFNSVMNGETYFPSPATAGN
jgi:DNA-binding NarL/FixJ family response regulator